MTELKLAQLPDRTPIKLAIVVTPELHNALSDYAAIHNKTYGLSEPMSEPILHIAERTLWEEARHTGSYPWSSHGTGFEAEGFVHLAYRRQVAGVLDRYFSRFEPEELVLLELDPQRARPVVEEGSTEAFPHLYAPLTREMVLAELDVH
jgi:hypothetical protein